MFVCMTIKYSVTCMFVCMTIKYSMTCIFVCMTIKYSVTCIFVCMTIKYSVTYMFVCLTIKSPVAREASHVSCVFMTSLSQCKIIMTSLSPCDIMMSQNPFALMRSYSTQLFLDICVYIRVALFTNTFIQLSNYYI